MADKKLNSVSSVTDAAYVYAETSNGETVKISKADLASVVAGVIGVNSFKSGTISGTSKDNYIQIATDVVTAMPFTEGTFIVQHKYAGQRLVYGYIYGGKLYGSLTIQQYEGNNAIVNLNNGSYSIRS